MADGTWSLADAKAKLSEVVERARTEGPQHITRNGKDAVVVVSTAEWRRRTQAPHSVLDFLDRSPLRGSGIDLERIADPDRAVEFE